MNSWEALAAFRERFYNDIDIIAVYATEAARWHRAVSGDIHAGMARDCGMCGYEGGTD